MSADDDRVEGGAPHSETCFSVDCPCYQEGRREVQACNELLGNWMREARRLQRALTWARYHLEHQEHGVDLCFACFLEGEIDKILDAGTLPGYPSEVDAASVDQDAGPGGRAGEQSEGGS